MTTAFDSLKSSVLALPDNQRREMLDVLSHSFGDATEQDWKAAWSGELGRRVDDLESGRVKGVPSDEVYRKLVERHG